MPVLMQSLADADHWDVINEVGLSCALGGVVPELVRLAAELYTARLVEDIEASRAGNKVHSTAAAERTVHSLALLLLLLLMLLMLLLILMMLLVLLLMLMLILMMLLLLMPMLLLYLNR